MEFPNSTLQKLGEDPPPPKKKKKKKKKQHQKNMNKPGLVCELS